MRDIFVSIASYRDPDLIHTLKSAIKNAEQPNKIHFGIVFQGTAKERPDFSFLENYSLISMHPRDARGAGMARSKAMSLYGGQEYYLQIDSHTQFVEHWDRKLILELEKARSLTKNSVILSAFPMPYSHEGPGGSIVLHDKPFLGLPAHPMKQIVDLRRNGDWASQRIEFDDPERKNPEISHTVLGGFIFTSGKIVSDVPYDPEISFMGEELCFAARAWTRGYDIYSPTIPILYHFYGRNESNKIWKDTSARKITWKHIEDNSKSRQRDVLCGTVKDEYGLGTNRSMDDFESMIGFNFKEFYKMDLDV